VFENFADSLHRTPELLAYLSCPTPRPLASRGPTLATAGFSPAWSRFARLPHGLESNSAVVRDLVAEAPAIR
jgi:hypothetical protein